MEKIDWKRKLTSRKFWVAIIGFATPLLTAFGVSDSEVLQVTSIIMAGGTLIAYILGEGFADASSAQQGSGMVLLEATDAIKIKESDK